MVGSRRHGGVPYGVLMTPGVPSMVAAAYVTDIDASRAFYRLLEFREHSSGKAEESAWSVMQHDGVSVLLASARIIAEGSRLTVGWPRPSASSAGSGGGMRAATFAIPAPGAVPRRRRRARAAGRS